MMGIYQDGEIERRALVTKSKKGAFQVNITFVGTESIPLVSGLRTESVISRVLCLPLKSKRAALEALPFQLESSLPGDVNDFIVVPHVEKVGKEEMRVDLHACKQQVLDEHTGTLSTPPDFVSSVPRALARYLCQMVSDKSSGVICHLGDDATDIVAVQDGKVALAIPILLGRNVATADLLSQIERAFYVIEQKWGSIGQVYLTGHFAESEELRQQLGCGILLGNEGESLAAISIGLAIDALADDALDFQQGALMPQRQLKRLGKRIFSALTMIAGVTIVAAMISTLFLQARERELSRAIAEFSTEYEKDLPHYKLLAKVKQGKRVSVENSLGLLRKLQKSFLKGQKPKNYYDEAPSVALFLAWALKETSLGRPGVALDEMSYELKKYPTLQMPQETYSAAVTIRFRALAEIGEKIKQELTDAKMVDHGHGIQWQEDESGYQAHFYISKRA
ncbi:MAG: hypothetical protein P0S94_00580 [Simkaniaceae bacterium]|nr:hypothetical protein [Simkaniaceae bacterium]